MMSQESSSSATLVVRMPGGTETPRGAFGDHFAVFQNILRDSGSDRAESDNTHFEFNHEDLLLTSKKQLSFRTFIFTASGPEFI